MRNRRKKLQRPGRDVREKTMTVISRGKDGRIIDPARITVPRDSCVYDVMRHIAENHKEETLQTGKK